MTRDDFRRKTLKLIKEKNLYNYIINENYDFSDSDLIKIAYDLSENYEERISFMEEASHTFSGKTANLALHIINDMKKIENIFHEKNDQCVYELHITEKPGSYTEKYLCASLSAAIKTLQWFCNNYNVTLDENSDISVYKRRIIGDDNEPDEDFIAEAQLDFHAKVISYYADMTSAGTAPDDECVNECDECTSTWLCSHVKYPRIINDMDIVRFDKGNHQTGYGIVMYCRDFETVTDYYVVEFSPDNFARETLYDPDHVHISPTAITKISKSELPEGYAEAYEATLCFL